MQAVDVYANYMKEAERWEELEAFRLTVRAFEQRAQDKSGTLQTRTSAEMVLAFVGRALMKVLTLCVCVCVCIYTHMLFCFGACIRRQGSDEGVEFVCVYVCVFILTCSFVLVLAFVGRALMRVLTVYARCVCIWLTWLCVYLSNMAWGVFG